MQIYLVGGAVRDRLLNRQVVEKDWVVVGATPQQLLAQGYSQVGKDFPVFLHPKTKDEYALARQERKTGEGYTGFECDFSESVTLEQDLLRRDLTVNAMAEDENGNIIDPYGGQKDLANKVLRHVSSAFIEDPLRVFRVARFASRYADLGFAVSTDTLSLMQTIASAGELGTISAERIWQETRRSLTQTSPAVYFQVLAESHCLQPWFEELHEHWHNPQLQQVLNLLLDVSELSSRIALLCSPLTLQQTEQWCARLRMPKETSTLARLCVETRDILTQSTGMNADVLLNVLDKCDAWRKPDQFHAVIEVISVFTNVDVRLPQRSKALLLKAYQGGVSVNVQDVIAQGHKGPAIREALRRARLEKIQAEID